MQRHKPTNNDSTKLARLKKQAWRMWEYCSHDVWLDIRHSWKVNLIKTLNLSIHSFLDRDLQSQACALTFRTMLAIIPALALIFAIARGFGLQPLIETELIGYFPSQETVLRTSFGFVDSYLSQASGGIFVGVGIVFLLWTLISLLSSVENSFNHIWQVAKGRSLWRKITDYVAIFLILPILMVCASGLSLFMSTSLRAVIPSGFAEPAIRALFDCASIVLSWLFFAGTYMLIPNTKVKPLNALLSGIIVGTAYQVLQWLFVSGQLYVSKYNAIYGSFSFLPLFLIWMQLVWLITLIGGVLCYSSQNIGEYNFGEKVKNISDNYRWQVTLVLMSAIARRFEQGKQPLSIRGLAQEYGLPNSLVAPLIMHLKHTNLVNFIYTNSHDTNDTPVQPALDISTLTVGEVLRRLITYGEQDFIPGFADRYIEVRDLCAKFNKIFIEEADKTKITSINII